MFSIGFLPAPGGGGRAHGALPAGEGPRDLRGDGARALHHALRRGRQGVLSSRGALAVAAAPVEGHRRTPYRLERILAFLDPWAHRARRLPDVGVDDRGSATAAGSGSASARAAPSSSTCPRRTPTSSSPSSARSWASSASVASIAALRHRRLAGPARRLRASRRFGSYLALGAHDARGVQALVNMGVVMGLLPTKGLTLPFVSYGGCSLVTSWPRPAPALARRLGGSSLREPGACAFRPRRRRPREDADRRRRDGRASLPGHRPGGGGDHPASGQRRAVRRHDPRTRGAGGPGGGVPAGDHRGAGPEGHGAPPGLRASLLLPLSFLVAGASCAACGPTWWWAWAATPRGRWCWPRGRGGVATAIQEQNALPGITNRILGRFVRRCSSPSRRRATSPAAEDATWSVTRSGAS